MLVERVGRPKSGLVEQDEAARCSQSLEHPGVHAFLVEQLHRGRRRVEVNDGRSLDLRQLAICDLPALADPRKPNVPQRSSRSP